MIALLLALAAADPPTAITSIDGLPLGGLPPQSLPAEGCAAYLFSAGKTRALAAVAGAQAGTLRLAIDGKPVDLVRTTQSGSAGYGFGGTTQYTGGGSAVTLDLSIQSQRSVTQGAVIDQATLRIDRPGEDTIVLPLAGLVGCAAATP